MEVKGVFNLLWSCILPKIQRVKIHVNENLEKAQHAGTERDVALTFCLLPDLDRSLSLRCFLRQYREILSGGIPLAAICEIFIAHVQERRKSRFDDTSNDFIDFLYLRLPQHQRK